MATKSGFKNRKKLNLQVKREFQRWLLTKVLVTVFISAVIAACILYFYARQEIVGSFFDAHIKLRRVSDLLFPVVMAGSVVSLIAGGLLALFLPQRIAGPIYRIEKGLGQVEDGDLTTRIQLRTEDTLQDFAENVTQTVGAIREQVQKLKDCSAQLEEAIGCGDQELVAQLLEKQKRLYATLKT